MTLCFFQPDDVENNTVSSSGAEAVLDAVDSLIEKVATSSSATKNATFEKPNLCKSIFITQKQLCNNLIPYDIGNDLIC